MATGGWLLVAAVSGSLAAWWLAPLAYEMVAAPLRVLASRARIATSGRNGSTYDQGRWAMPFGEVGEPVRLPMRMLVTALRGVPGSHSTLMRRLVASPRCGAPIRGLSSNLRRLGVVCDDAALLLCMVEAMGVAFVLAGLALASPVAGALAAAAISLLSCHLVDGRVRRRDREMRSQIPDALTALGVALGSGYALPQAFSYTAAHTPPPLSRELERVVWDIDAGRSIDEALDGLQRRANAPELRYVAVAMEVQHHSGGSLREIIACAVQGVRGSFDLERSLQVQTAQARLSARVVGLLPIGLLGVLALAAPGYLESFLDSPMGLGMLAVAIVLDVVGLLIIRSIVDAAV